MLYLFCVSRRPFVLISIWIGPCGRSDGVIIDLFNADESQREVSIIQKLGDYLKSRSLQPDEKLTDEQLAIMRNTNNLLKMKSGNIPQKPVN